MKKSHLSLEERTQIQLMLQDGCSFRVIADELNRAPSTISNEFNIHKIVKSPKGCDCVYKHTCKEHNVCANNKCNTNARCKECSYAKKNCFKYEKLLCSSMKSDTFKVCNKCRNQRNCHLEKTYYYAKDANNDYRENLYTSRAGFDCTKEDLDKINNIVSPLVKRGQSIYHIYQQHKDELGISQSTLRRMIDKSVLECRNIDLPETVQRQVKKVRPRNHRQFNMNKAGHYYEDYLEFLKTYDGIIGVQMDCVEGSKDSYATLLTLHFVHFHMQLAFIMDDQTSDCVVHTLDMIEKALGKELFAVCFPYILTDNGHEFQNIDKMERSIYGGKRTRIFFCEPNRSDEKGACENNHKFIRRVIPKGTNMDSFRQSQINLMMNHINSTARNSLIGKTPYDAAMALMPEDFFTLLGLEKVESDEVLLKPSLIKI